MKNHILYLLFFLSFTNSFSQKKSNVKCGFFGNKTVEQRNAIFPFSESKKILLISYPNEDSFIVIDDDGNQRTSKNDSLDLVRFGFKIEKEFSFKKNDSAIKKVYNATKIIELSKTEINEFSNWLINYEYKIVRKNKPVVNSLNKCYTPRNAVVFLNAENEVISILEICFECGHYYLLPDPNGFGRTLGINCDEKLKYFRTLFENKGFSFIEH